MVVTAEDARVALLLAASAGVGLALGVGISYFGSSTITGPDSGIVQFVLLLGAGMAMAVGLLVAAMVNKSRDPLVAAAALVAAAVIGSMIAPGAPGSAQSGSGQGAAGTRQNPTAFWSGSVACRWQQGAATVELVTGFDVLVSDLDLLAALGLDEPAPVGPEVPVRVVAIVLPSDSRVGGRAGLGVAEDADGWGGMGKELTLEGLSSDRRTGTAVATDEAIVFTWSCTQGS